MVSGAKTGVQRRAERIVSHEGARPFIGLGNEIGKDSKGVAPKKNPIALKQQDFNISLE